MPPLARRAWHARGLGDFWAHMLVAEGAVDGAVDALGVSEWDLAAVQVIVEEAGGRFSDSAGESRIDSAAPSRRTACCTTSFSAPSRGRALRLGEDGALRVDALEQRRERVRELLDALPLERAVTSS